MVAAGSPKNVVPKPAVVSSEQALECKNLVLKLQQEKKNRERKKWDMMKLDQEKVAKELEERQRKLDEDKAFTEAEKLRRREEIEKKIKERIE